MKNKIITVLLAVIFAVGLWVYVITVERPESENTFYNVSVVLEGETFLKEDRGMMITNQGQQTVTLRLSGNRKVLNQLQISGNLNAVVDLSRIKEAGNKNLSYTVDLPDGVEMVSRNPEYISLTVTQWDSVEVPVVMEFAGRLPEGYYVDKQSATSDPALIRVTGPKDVVNTIVKAEITVDLNGVTETLVEDHRPILCDAQDNVIDNESLQFDYETVRATVPVQQLKELQLVYEIKDGGGLKEEDVTVTPSAQTITVSGSAVALQNLNEISLGTVDLGTLTESGQVSFPIKLPEGVINQSGIEEVTLDVELPEMEIRDYGISNIRLENVPQGWTAQSLAQALTVKIRGRGPVLDRIDSEMLCAVVDLTDAAPGTATYKAQIEIEGFGEADNVGAVDGDKYTVLVQVEDPTAVVIPPPIAGTETEQ